MKLKAVFSGFQKAKSAAAQAFDALDQTRVAVDEARARIKAIEAAPIPLADGIASFITWLDSAASSAISSLAVYHFAQPGGKDEIKLHQPALLGLVALIGRDRLISMARDQLADFLDGQEPLADDERARRLAQAKDDQLSAELMEEVIVRALLAEGVNVVRRPDADPRALLAADASLPS